MTLWKTRRTFAKMQTNLCLPLNEPFTRVKGENENAIFDDQCQCVAFFVQNKTCKNQKTIFYAAVTRRALRTYSDLMTQRKQS